jgi:hypothetical protein
MSRRVRLSLGQRQADALLEAASRGLDESQADLEDENGNGSVNGTAADQRKALEAYRVLASALEEARR